MVIEGVLGPRPKAVVPGPDFFASSWTDAMHSANLERAMAAAAHMKTEANAVQEQALRTAALHQQAIEDEEDMADIRELMRRKQNVIR